MTLPKLIEFLGAYDKKFKLLPFQKALLVSIQQGERIVFYRRKQNNRELLASGIALELMVNPHYKVEMDADMARRVKRYLEEFKSLIGNNEQ